MKYTILIFVIYVVFDILGLFFYTGIPSVISFISRRTINYHAAQARQGEHHIP